MSAPVPQRDNAADLALLQQSRQAMRAAAQSPDAIAQSLAATMAPLLQTHPVLLACGGFLAGALLVKSRPWQLLLDPAVRRVLLPMVASYFLKDKR